MQKTMKKLLSIILAILMIVTTVPMAFAAEGETRTLYVKEEVTGFNFGYEYWFVDADGNDLNCTYEDLGDNWYKYTVPVSAAKYYMWKGIGGGDSYPYEPIPEKVDTLINRNGEAEWYCSHQMNTSGEQNCKGFLCEICGETYGEADLSAHKIKDGICEVCGEADSDAPLIIDVTDEDYVGIGEGARFYDKDGYILTGINENCYINIYESSNITLRNLFAKSMRINSPDGAFITIKLEGINELAVDLSFYKDHIIFEGSDDAIFKADYIYNGGTSEASVTLNGGNIVFESVSRENFTVNCGKLIINGGTLTASNDSCYVIGSPVELNGGELNIISTSQQYPAILKKITMKKGALLTLSAKTRILDDSAEITVADGLAESDNLLVRYDTESEFVPAQDIKVALDGKTYAEIKVDTHVHSYEDSEWNYSTEKHWKECSCGEIGEEAAHTYIDGKCDVCGAEVKDITITMNDSYGDGWSYNAIQVGFVSEGVFTKIADATIDEGSTATNEITIPDDKVYAFRWTKGDYSDECSFTISVDGEIIFEKSDCSDFADNEFIYIDCNHNYTDSVCSICGLTCGVDFSHNMNGGDECISCGYVCYHNYTNHYCKICGNVEDGYYAGACGANDVNDVIWSLDSEGTLIISGEGEYDIPYCDAPWKAYGENIKNVVIEEGITNIAAGSFYDLPNTVTLSIPSTVASIDTYCNNGFVEIKLADGNNNYRLIDGVLFNYDGTELIMYPAKKAGETYTVPDGVTILGGYAFDSSNNLKTVNISDDVTTIKNSCFANSYSIENINFGKNVEVIESNAFAYAGLKIVVLPEKLEEIPYGLFYSCDLLENLVIGSNVTSIEEDVIQYCNNLKTVHFTGTEEQWQAITKPDDSEDAINTIEVHFGALEEKDGIDATCAEAGHTAGLYCDECNAYLIGEEIPATGEHTYVDGKCECGDECKHPGQTGAECEICGSALHVCDFSGEWKYDSEKHWKECTCGETDKEAVHTLTEGKCECGYECPHEWVGVAFVKPTRTEEGYYTYTCSVCKSTKTEPVERASNYAEFKELLEKVKGYLDENLTDSMMQEVKNVINFFELDENHGFIKGEENTVSQMIRQISGFVEVVEEGIADGTAVKVDGFTVYNERGREWLLKFADEGIFEKARELILNSTEVKAKMDEIYDFALSLEGNVAENAENIAKIEADVDEFFGQLKKCVYGIHNVSQYKEISPAKCGENAVESATCTLCGETVTREVENSALKHSFTKYEVTEEAKCGVAGKEVAYCDNGCGATDEKAIEALKHSLVLIKTTPAKCGEPMVEFYNCEFCCNCEVARPKFGTELFHSFTKYEITEAPTCNKAGEKAAPCDNGCGEIDVQTVPALDDHVDADGDYKCDFGCGHEFEKPAPEDPAPDTPDEPTDSTCDHLCHKSGFMGFLWKIVQFFSKLFKINPTCECGAAHY